MAGTNEKSKLLLDRYQDGYSIPISGVGDKQRRASMQILLSGSTEMARTLRSNAESRLGGSSSMGSFRMVTSDDDDGGDNDATNDGENYKILTPSEMGQQQLYEKVPFQAVFGLQRKGHEVATAFAIYAADLDADSTTGLSDLDKDIRRASSSMLILDEMEEAKVVTAPLIFAVIVAATSMFLLGYNGGVLNAPEKVVFPGHATVAWSIATSILPIGALFGSMVGGTLADQRGRRGAMMIEIWIFIVGGLVQTVAPNMVCIIIARFVIGYACGIATTVVPIYLGEMAPPSLRGTLGTMTQFAQNIGIFMSALMAMPLRTEWRILFAVTPVLAVGQVLLSSFLLESPRWLLSKDTNSLRARYVIKRLRGLRNEQEVEREVGYFLGGASAQDPNKTTKDEKHDEHSNNNNANAKNNNRGLLQEIWNDTKRRKLLISCLVLPMAQQLSGINAIIYYSGSFFDGIIADPLVGTVIVFGVNIAASYVSLLLMNSTGRKTLILCSSAGMIFSCILVTVALMGIVSNTYAIVAVALYLIFFQIGLGPIPWLIVAEMFDGKYVALVMSLSSQLNWICNSIVGFVFPSLNAALTPYTFVPFIIVLIFTFLFTMFFVPETQGTTPEDLVAEMKESSHDMVYSINKETAGEINEEWEKAFQQLLEEENKATSQFV